VAAGFALVTAGTLRQELYLEGAYLIMPLLFAPYVRLQATYAVDGETVTSRGFFTYGDGDAFDLANVPRWPGVAAAGLLPALVPGPAAVALPRRLNRC
jgi:hypothetical protein